MLLPIFKTAIQELSLMQTKWASILNPLIKNPLLNGHIIENITLPPDRAVIINHKLGRKLVGWFVIRYLDTTSSETTINGVICEFSDAENLEINLALGNLTYGGSVPATTIRINIYVF